MLVTKYENKADWLAGRAGKIGGSSLKNIVSKGGATKEMIMGALDADGIEYKKASKKDELEALLPPGAKGSLIKQLPKKNGFFELIAYRLGIPPEEGENPMDRGSEMEAEAVAKFAEKTSKKLDTSLVIWSREDNENITVSPDAFEVVDEGKVITEAVEIKCLGSVNHLKAWYYQAVPDDYWFQVIQYFIVNENLQTLFFVLYDPRFDTIPFVVIEVSRAQVQQEVDEYLEYQQTTIAEVNEIVNRLTF